jgi:hypothetical protein
MVKMADDSEKLQKTHDTALKRFDRIEKRERDQRKLAVEDIKFAQTEDGQWDEDAISKRAGRPRYTINRVAGAVDQLIGDQRQNRTDIKVRPVSGGATEDVAKVLTGIIRNIESNSKADNAYDAAFDEVVNGGYGGWRVITEFNDDDAFEQDIKIKQINTATTSLWFGPSEEYDKRDATHAFYTVNMPKEEHKERFPDSPAIDWSQEKFSQSGCNTWVEDDSIRVAEYWVKTPIDKNIALMSDARVIDIDEEKAVMDELAQQGITIKKQRKVKSHKVEMYLMDASGILEGPKDWAGKFIPLIPMYGRQISIENQTFTRGLVRFSKDPQRIYNYTTSAAIETAALTPKDPIWLTAKQAEGHHPQLKNFNTQNSPFMFYNGDPSVPGPPQRGGAPAVQSAFIQQIQQASMDLYHVTNMQPPSIGANPELKSGKAIQAQERLGDRGSFIFTDNLVKSQEYCADILIDLIPRIIDTERQVRIMAQDGESENVFVNQSVRDKDTQKDVLVNDLSLGKYDQVAATGPAFATQRQESAQQILDLIATSPMFENLAMDLVAKDLPILESKELTKRVRKLQIQQNIVTPTEEEIKELGLDKPQEPDPQQVAVTENIQIQTEKLISDIELQDAKTLQTTIDTQNSTIKAYSDLIDAFKAQQESGIPFTRTDHNIRVKQQDIVMEAQEQIDEGPNTEQAASIVQDAVSQEQAVEADNARRLTVEQPSASIGQDDLNG